MVLEQTHQEYATCFIPSSPTFEDNSKTPNGDLIVGDSASTDSKAPLDALRSFRIGDMMVNLVRHSALVRNTGNGGLVVRPRIMVHK